MLQQIDGSHTHILYYDCARCRFRMRCTHRPDEPSASGGWGELMKQNEKSVAAKTVQCFFTIALKSSKALRALGFSTGLGEMTLHPEHSVI